MDSSKSYINRKPITLVGRSVVVRLDRDWIFDWHVSQAYAITFLCILSLQYILKLIPYSELSFRGTKLGPHHISTQFSISNSSIWPGVVLPNQVLPLWARVDLGAMAMKGYSAFPIASALLPRPLDWAVWHLCKMGYRNQWQIRGRKAPNFGWATLGWASSLFVPYVPLV